MLPGRIRLYMCDQHPVIAPGAPVLLANPHNDDSLESVPWSEVVQAWRAFRGNPSVAGSRLVDYERIATQVLGATSTTVTLDDLLRETPWGRGMFLAHLERWLAAPNRDSCRCTGCMQTRAWIASLPDRDEIRPTLLAPPAIELVTCAVCDTVIGDSRSTLGGELCAAHQRQQDYQDRLDDDRPTTLTCGCSISSASLRAVDDDDATLFTGWIDGDVIRLNDARVEIEHSWAASLVDYPDEAVAVECDLCGYEFDWTFF